MSRDFSGANAYIDCGVGVDPNQGGVPFSCCGWFYYTGTFPSGARIQSRWGSGNFQRYLLSFEGTTKLQLAILGSDLSGQLVVGNTSVVAGTWNHAAATFTPNVSLVIYLNGAQDGINTTAIKGNLSGATPPLNLRFGIDATGGGGQWQGQLAEQCVWVGAALTASEVRQIANGADPTTIQPSTMAGYWPLCGYASPEPDLVKGNQGSITGTVTGVTFHPRANVCNQPAAAYDSGRGSA